MENGKKSNAEVRATQIELAEAKATNEARITQEDRVIGIKFEALKVLTGFYAANAKHYSGKDLGKEVNAFLTESGITI